MPVELPGDRAALLADFGVAARITPSSGAVDVVGIFDRATAQVAGVASEVDVLTPSPTLLVRTEELGGLRVGQPVEVLEGPGADTYLAKSILAEDDGAFTRIELGK